jgi:hypothetical protein
MLWKARRVEVPCNGLSRPYQSLPQTGHAIHGRRDFDAPSRVSRLLSGAFAHKERLNGLALAQT